SRSSVARRGAAQPGPGRSKPPARDRPTEPAVDPRLAPTVDRRGLSRESWGLRFEGETHTDGEHEAERVPARQRPASGLRCPDRGRRRLRGRPDLRAGVWGGRGPHRGPAREPAPALGLAGLRGSDPAAPRNVSEVPPAVSAAG